MDTSWGIATVKKVYADGDLELQWPSSDKTWTLHEQHVKVISARPSVHQQKHSQKANPASDTPNQNIWQTELHEEVYNYLRYKEVPQRLQTPTARKQFRSNVKKRFFIEGTELYRKRERVPRNTSMRAQMVQHTYPARMIPTAAAARTMVFEDHARTHDGHNRVEKRLGAKYYIAGLRELVAEARRHCAICEAWVPQKKEISEFIFTKYPMQLLIFDLTKMEMECSETGHWYILVARCHFSKYLWTRSTATKTKEEVVSALNAMMREEAGFERWHCDNGGEFVNDLMEALIEAFGNPRYSHSVPRNPRCQGLVEIANRCVKRKLTQLCMAEGYDTPGKPFAWTRHLQNVTVNENESPHGLYNIPPFFVLRLKWPGEPHCPYLGDAARERMYEAMASKQVEYANKRTVGVVPAFGVGDYVAVKAGHNARKEKKAIAPWAAKGEVIAVHAVNENHYRVRWLTPGLSNEPAGAIAGRWYNRTRLRATTFEGRTQAESDVPLTGDKEYTHVHVPAAVVQNILPPDFERSQEALTHLFLLGVVRGPANAQQQWRIDITAIGKQFLVSTRWLRRHGELWVRHGSPLTEQSYHESDEDAVGAPKAEAGSTGTASNTPHGGTTTPKGGVRNTSTTTARPTSERTPGAKSRMQSVLSDSEGNGLDCEERTPRIQTKRRKSPKNAPKKKRNSRRAGYTDGRIFKMLNVLSDSEESEAEHRHPKKATSGRDTPTLKREVNPSAKRYLVRKYTFKLLRNI